MHNQNKYFYNFFLLLIEHLILSLGKIRLRLAKIVAWELTRLPMEALCAPIVPLENLQTHQDYPNAAIVLLGRQFSIVYSRILFIRFFYLI